ncbi:hypothetical protein [Undibacterium flavidum]|uniref:YiaAB two helix domain-containing protein n=1 Tax=Undibacterium flavidum TaxID=2762297 RepID=A0ABR6Y939_9BURK|nr:hypothetical protein [Undibacterium flavidum]MBC3873123.1 hypothetical protein [Undibacterium flavidum]
MPVKLLTNNELNAFEQKWRRVFSAYGTVLASALVYLVAFYPRGNEKSVCYVLGSLSAIGCLHAAKKLRDTERVDSVVDVENLIGGHMDGGVGDLDD